MAMVSSGFMTMTSVVPSDKVSNYCPTPEPNYGQPSGISTLPYRWTTQSSSSTATTSMTKASSKSGLSLPTFERPSSAWSHEDDLRLMQCRASGMNWAPIANRHFPAKTSNACRKRHERLMEKRNAESWDGVKVEDLAKSYLECRETMWKIIAEKVGEKWQTVETKCMEKGLKTLQSAGRRSRHQELLSTKPSSPQESLYYEDSGVGMSEISGLGGPLSQKHRAFRSPPTAAGLEKVGYATQQGTRIADEESELRFRVRLNEHMKFEKLGASENGDTWSPTESRDTQQSPKAWTESSDDETTWDESASVLGSLFKSCPSGRDSSTSVNQGSSSQATSSSDHKQRNRAAKRKRNESLGDDGDDDGEDEHHKRQHKENLCLEEENRLLACPFCKYKPRSYRKCYKYILKEISRLKQHLSRCHRIPIHCALCSQTFESDGQRDDHLRRRSCEFLPPKEWEGVNDSQKKQLEQRISTSKSREENWYIIYEILFPDAILPKSPYIDPHLSEELLALQELAIAQGPSIVRNFVEAELPDSLRPNEEEVQAFCVRLFQDAVVTLLERWEATNPSSGTRISLSSSVSGAASQPQRESPAEARIQAGRAGTTLSRNDTNMTSLISTPNVLSAQIPAGESTPQTINLQGTPDSGYGSGPTHGQRLHLDMGLMAATDSLFPVDGSIPNTTFMSPPEMDGPFGGYGDDDLFLGLSEIR